MFISPVARRLWMKLNETIDALPENVSCRDSDPDAWFPDEDLPKAAYYTNAKTACMACPVRLMCLDYAMTNNEQHGLWGGLTPPERLLIRRKKLKEKRARKNL